MDSEQQSQKYANIKSLPDGGRNFFRVDVPEIGRAMLEKGQRVHSYSLKSRGFKCEDPLKIHFVANNDDVIDLLHDGDNRLDLSHYDDALKSGGDGATFFISNERGTLETQWEIFEQALKLRPELPRFLDPNTEKRDVYDLIQEQAELAVQEAIVEIYERRDNPSLLTRLKGFFVGTQREDEVDIIREYGLVVAHIFVRDFLGLRIPGRTLYRQTQKFYLWIAIMFANLFMNPGGRNSILNKFSTVVSKMYRRRILKSYKDPKHGSILHRLRIIGEQEVKNGNGETVKKYGTKDEPFEDYVVNIIMEVAGSFQYLTGSSFGSIIRTIDENESGGFGEDEIPKLIKKINQNPRAWIDEYLRHNSPTGFIFRKVKKPFIIEDTDMLPGDMVCLITGEASKDEAIFGPKGILLEPDKSKSLCPRHSHFGSPDSDPNNGKPIEDHHPCFGQYWGRIILQTMLEGLLYFRWLHAAKDASFKTQWGIFPSFKMTFAKEAKSQEFVTILSEIPKKTGNLDAAQKFLENLGHYHSNAYQELGLSSRIHFMSGHVVRGKENLTAKLPFGLRLPFMPKDEPDYLVLELSTDGNFEELLPRQTPTFYNWIANLYDIAGITDGALSREAMKKRLFNDHVTLVQSIWPSLFHAKSTNGLPFSGTEGLNSLRIQAEHEIATRASKLVRKNEIDKKTYHGRLHVLRRSLKNDLIENGGGHPGNWGWVLGGSEAPHFSETRDDSWIEKDDHEKPSLWEYLGLARKLFPRILFVPLAFLFIFLAAGFYENPNPTRLKTGLYTFSATKSFAHLMGAILLGGLIGMIGRRYGKLIDSELGEMFLVTSFFLGFLIFGNSWVSLSQCETFRLWEYPGLGPIPKGAAFPIAIGVSGILLSIFYYLKLKLEQPDEYFSYKPHSKSIGFLILWLLIGTMLYLHVFWMLPGKLIGNGNYLISNRFNQGELKDHIFYPILNAGVIMFTAHAYRKSFFDPSCRLNNKLNKWLFFSSTGLIWFCVLFPIKSWSYVINFVRDASVYTFFIPLVISTTLLFVFRFLNPATATTGRRKSNFIREVCGWGVLASILLNLNSSIRDFWGTLFGVSPWTGKDLDQYVPQIIAIAKSFIIAFPMTLISIFIIVFILQKFTLRASEKDNTPHDSDPGIGNTKNLMSQENKVGSEQNHMMSVQRLLPEWFRIRVLLPLSFHVIRRMLTTGIIRPGFLGNVGTVHFARWIHLPRTRNYAFLSNYDGSFESYLEDFVTKVNAGLNAAWSHCIGFPKVKNIFVEGTEDGDRFKRWARGSTRPTPFWYSAYPELTVEVIRRNALIRDGLVRARSASEAEAWFDLFNSTTRPEHALQTDQIQSFVFGGAAHLESGCCLVIQAQDTETVSYFRTLLESLEDEITFGQNKPEQRAVYFAISNHGIHNLQIGGQERETKKWQGDQSLNNVNEAEPTWFSSPFILGMDNEERARVLGDIDNNHRKHWSWGSYTDEVNENEPKHDLGVLLIYASNDQIRDRFVEDLEQRINGTNIKFHQVNFKNHKPEVSKNENSEGIPKVDKTEKKLVREPFGFVDGISNPIIRGTTRAAKNSASIHLVNPGEFVLGYRDNRGYFPPSPQVAAFDDINRLLPALPNQQPQKYPSFGETGTDGLRDLGRNGSYLVIRQLEQDKDEFKRQTNQQAEKTLEKLTNKDINDIPLKDVKIMQSIIQAKMMGRWHDGQSLVTRPAYINEFCNNLESGDPTVAKNEVTKKLLHEDNEFLFGRDDPQGYACPFGSHVRRSNPRDSLDPNNPEELEVTNRHRLLRRGRTYKDEELNTEGTFFMCLNADIDRQFEFVQQTWINGRNFHGLRNEYDPISTVSGEFTIQCPGTNFPVEIESFVKTKGGGYFFMPSKDSLLYFMKDRDQTIAEVASVGMATRPARS